MKFRIITLIGFLAFSITLAGCSLAEDITPPPGFQSPTLDAISSTPEPSLPTTPTVTSDRTIPSSTIEPNFADSTLAASSTEVGINASAPFLKFDGKVTNASGSPIPDSLIAHLYLYKTGSSAIDQTLTTRVQPTGQYQFDHVPADSKTTYFVVVEFDGVTYTSDPVIYDGTFTTHDMPVSVYDSTSDLLALSFSQIHMQFDFTTDGQVQARMLYIVSNLGLKSVVVQSDGTSIPFIKIPDGAADVKYDLAQGGAPLASATNGFALLPGADKQYGIIATFSLPYTRNLKIVQPFSVPVSSETVIVPVGVRVSSDQLEDTGTQTFQGTNFHLYQGGNLASGSTLTLTISGKPGDATASFPSRQTSILIGIGAAGILLIGVGIYLFLRDRARIKQPEAILSSEIAADTPGDDRDTIIDAIIALDEQYKGGCISKEAYQKRRDELKNRLRELY